MATTAETIPPQAGQGNSTTDKSKLSWFVRKYLSVVDYLSSRFLGGPRCIKQAHVINIQKGGTLLVCAYMMRRANNFTATACCYTALHGGYGLCWLLKEMIFPDPKWQTKITIGSALATFAVVLGPYWGIAHNAIMGRAERSNVSLCGAAIVYMLGLCLMMGSDGQKFFVLKRVKGLITDGFFARTRHPNYLGEMMIYGSFAFVSNHPASWVILGCIWGGLFLPFMLQKEERMSRYPQWATYVRQSGFLIPRLFPAKAEQEVGKEY